MIERSFGCACFCIGDEEQVKNVCDFLDNGTKRDYNLIITEEEALK